MIKTSKETYLSCNQTCSRLFKIRLLLIMIFKGRLLRPWRRILTMQALNYARTSFIMRPIWVLRLWRASPMFRTALRFSFLCESLTRMLAPQISLTSHSPARISISLFLSQVHPSRQWDKVSLWSITRLVHLQGRQQLSIKVFSQTALSTLLTETPMELI